MLLLKFCSFSFLGRNQLLLEFNEKKSQTSPYLSYVEPSYFRSDKFMKIQEQTKLPLFQNGAERIHPHCG